MVYFADRQDEAGKDVTQQELFSRRSLLEALNNLNLITYVGPFAFSLFFIILDYFGYVHTLAMMQGETKFQP